MNALGSKSKRIYYDIFSTHEDLFYFRYVEGEIKKPIYWRIKTVAPSVGCQGVSSSIYIHKYYFKALFL